MPNPFWEFKPGNRPLAIAHRGGDAAGKPKQNTVEAFSAAQKLGYRYVETDVILAASGELVLVHGARNWLQAGVGRDITRKNMQKMSLEQMRAIVKPGGGEVPTLDEVLRTFPKTKFILDLKTDEEIQPLAKLIKRLKAQDRVCICGFDYKRTEAIKEIFGRLPITYALTIGRGIRFKNMNLLLLKKGQLKGVEAVFLHHSLVSPPMIHLIHRRGLKAVVWTANSSIGIKHAVRSGVDGIISDRVVLLSTILDRARPTVTKSTK
jgi:glycerophosphoryl diester phosphodiesterase